MEKLVIKGGKKPQGCLKISAAKNSVLPILACCTMSRRDIVLQGVAPMGDVLQMVELIKSLGGVADWDGDNLTINCNDIGHAKIDTRFASKMRASIFLLGPLGVRVGLVTMGRPGGCNIGARPIDIHMSALRQLGLGLVEEENLVCRAERLRAATIRLPYPSVGATENIMMAACGIKGTTTIINAAQEPEIADLADFINALGGDVKGAGTQDLTISGGRELGGNCYAPIGDRIVAGTYLASACGIGGDVTIKGINPMHLQAPLKVLQDKGCKLDTTKDSVRAIVHKRSKSAKRITTRTYPGFPTDLQAQFCAVECISSGQSKIIENLFENRFGHLLEFEKMGANISIAQNCATINGVDKLYGTQVDAQDLRGGAALVLAGAFADGTTTINNAHHIYRGYSNIVTDLQSLGVAIENCNNEN